MKMNMITIKIQKNNKIKKFKVKIKFLMKIQKTLLKKMIVIINIIKNKKILKYIYIYLIRKLYKNILKF